MSNNIVANKRIAKNTLFLYVRMAFVLLISLYTTRIVLKVLGIEDYGIYNVVAGFVSMFGFLNTTLTSSIQRFYNYESGHNGEDGWHKVYIISIYVELLFSFVIFVLLETFGFWYISNELVIPIDRLAEAKILFQCSAIQLIIVMMQAPFSAMIMAKERMNYYAFVGVLEVVLKLILIIVMPFIALDKLVVFGLLNVTLSLLVFLLYFMYVKIEFPKYKFTLFWDSTLIKGMLSFSGWNIWGSAAMILRNQGVNILLNSFFGPAINAARGIAFQIQAAMLGFTQNLTIAVRPQLTESYAKNDYLRSQSLMFSISKISFILLYLISLPVIYEVELLLKLWLGNSVPEYTTQFTRLILISALIDILNTPITILIMASGKIKVYSLLTSFIGVLVLPVSYICLKLGFRPTSVFIVGIFVSLVVQIVSLYVMKEQVNISLKLYSNKIIFPLLSLVLTTFFLPILVRMFCENVYWELLLVFILTTISILITAYYLVLNKTEREYILRVLKI